MVTASPSEIGTRPAMASAADTTMAATASPGTSQDLTVSNASSMETEDVPLRVFGPFGREAVAIKTGELCPGGLVPQGSGRGKPQAVSCLGPGTPARGAGGGRSAPPAC